MFSSFVEVCDLTGEVYMFVVVADPYSFDAVLKASLHVEDECWYCNRSRAGYAESSLSDS